MDEYIGMIKFFVGDYAPQGYLFCDGSLLPVQQYQALYTIIGTRYGGTPNQNFKLPDFRGRLPIGMGIGVNPTLTPRQLGQSGGEETVTLTSSQIPPHTHTYNALSGNREATSPAGNFLGTAAGNFYSQQDPGDQLLPMNAGVIAPTGGGQAHNNMPPFLCVNFIICVDGIYPVRSN
jgi:microcystin-dependent protein